MIKTLLFDFGDVFINLDKERPYNEFKKLGFNTLTKDMLKVNEAYEVGDITTENFLDFYIKTASKQITTTQVKNAWNSMLLDFPIHRLRFIKELASVRNFNLILFSNTNHLHIDWIKQHIPYYQDFRLCFNNFYLSQDIHLRKPDSNSFKHILKENDIIAQEVLFIDDTTENTAAAKSLGFSVWNINAKTEDVVDLFSINSHLF